MKKGRLMFAIVALFLGLLAGQPAGSQGSSHKFFLDFVDAYMVYEIPSGKLQIAAEGNVLSYGTYWTVLKAEPNIYHLKHKWMTAGGGFYWKVYLSPKLKRACKVRGGTFGQPGGTETPLHCKVEVVTSAAASGSPIRFILRFTPDSKAYLVYSGGTEQQGMQIWAEENTLSYAQDWNATFKPADQVYHLSQASWQGFFWKVDINLKKAWRVSGGAAGSSGTLTPLKCGVRVIY